MIEDVEGATAEPPRRRHVAVLSVGVAAFSFALLQILIAPPATNSEAPLAASPSPRPSGDVTLTIASNPLANMRVDLSRTVACADGTRLVPPYFVSVELSSGRMFAVSGDDRRTDRVVPVVIRPPSVLSRARWDDRAGWLTLTTCASPELDALLE